MKKINEQIKPSKQINRIANGIAPVEKVFGV